MGTLIDLSGQRFGHLTVIGRYGTARKGEAAKWQCLCDCGNTAIVTSSNLRYGNQVSCGCQRIKKSLLNIARYNEQHRSTRNRRIFRIWVGMRNRCGNPQNDSYPYYGGRGIAVCDEWKKYELFENWALSSGYLENLTLDRIDVNGPYSPDNCRWVTMKEQAYNRRDNRRISYQGKCLTITEWAKILKCSPSCLYYRLDAGWPIEEVLSLPPNRRKRHK